MLVDGRQPYLIEGPHDAVLLALAERMRELGFSVRTQQTVAAAEKASRRVTADEILGLALCLETTIAALMTAAGFDGLMELPNGKPIGAISVERLSARQMAPTAAPAGRVIGNPQARTASYWACRVAQVVGWSRSSVLAYIR